MMKHTKKAISFFMAVCLLAGNSYVGTASTSVSVTPIVQEVSEAETVENSAQSKVGTILGGIYDSVKTWSAGIANKVRTASAEETEEAEYRYVLDLIGQTIENGSATAKMETSSARVTLNRVDADGKSADISVIKNVKFESSNTNIISVIYGTDAGLDMYSAILTQKGPGWATIRVTIEEEHEVTNEDGSVTTEQKTSYFTATFLVSSELDRSDSEAWINVGETQEILVLDPTKLEDGSYQLKFKDIANSEDISNCVEFETPSPAGVVSISEDGLIKIIGAGVAKVNIKNYADVTIVEGGTERVTVEENEIKIIVLPTGSKDAVNYDKTVEVEVPPVAGEKGSSFVLYTNALDAANTLTWQIYKVNQNGTLGDRIAEDDTTLLSYTFDADKISFTNVKAGTYRVKAYVTNEYSESIIPALTFDIVVKLNLFSDDVYVNVGDIYDIVANSNIPEGMFEKLFTVLVDPQSEAYAVTNRETGIITALAYGTQKVELAYKKSDGNGIFTVEEADKIQNVVYTIQVIDTLSISPSSAIMYTGGEMTLKANTTQHGTIYWEVSETDQKYINVSSNGVVKAVTKTPDNYEATVVAYQIIGGVTKRAECKIQVYDTATTIKLQPAEVEIAVGETKTIEAILTPDNLNSFNLRWQSMNEEIFTLGTETDTNIQIIGKAAGTATLIVINEDNGEMGYCKVVVKESVSKVTLDYEKITGLEGDTWQLVATVTPEEATDKELYWWAVDTSVATVNQNGKVTFKKEGTTVICVRSVDNPELQAACTVVVSKMLSGINILEATNIEMYVGETHIVSYKITPDNASDKNVTWTSFNTKVVTVDKEGKLTAKSPGTALVMVMSDADPSIYVMLSITVKLKATSVKMNYKEIVMNRGEYFDMEVTIAPANSTEASLIWESLDTKVATVSSNGRITARAAGTAIVLVRTESGATSYCTVKVLEPVTSLELDPTDLVIEVGEIFAIEPVFKPTEPSNVEVKWTSYDKDIATVNSMGEVEGISRGSTVIICESVDGGYKAFCLVTVMDPDLVITVSPDNYRLGYGKSYTLEATVTNHGKVVDDMEVIWISSDESICTVDENGKIYGEGFGDAVITVMLEDDEYGTYATCAVRVVREVTSIKLNHSTLTVIKGQTADLNVTVQPSNATYSDVTFSSDDESIAVIDEDGVITALEVGSTWIWAKAKDNSGKYARCYLTVIEPISATGVTVSDKQVVLVAGETKKLTYTVKPSNTTDDIVWTSGNEAIATVDGSGVITAHRTGTTNVTIMTTSGKTAQVEVVVIGLSRTTLELPVYTQYSKLTVDGAIGTVRWDVQDQTICEVSNGVITARKAGTTYVTATVNGRTLRCKVTVTANKKK